MEERHREPILQHLIETYDLDETTYLLRDALMEVARNSVMDNLEDYFTDFKTSISGSFLEELDDLNLQVRFRDTLIASVQYMLLYRCGFDPKDTFDNVPLTGIPTERFSEMLEQKEQDLKCPIYPYSLMDARSRGELDEWRKSHNATCECAQQFQTDYWRFYPFRKLLEFLQPT